MSGNAPLFSGGGTRIAWDLEENYSPRAPDHILSMVPIIYYIFDYATTKFSSLLYSGNKAVPEFLGFAMCLTYLLFLLVYFREYEMKNKAEQYNELIRMQLNSFCLLYTSRCV